LYFYGCTVLDQGVFKNLVKRIESNAIAPIVAKTFLLTRLADAQRYFETKQHIGKLVIDLSNV